VTLSGAYISGGGASGAEKIGAWRGSPVTIVSTYLDHERWGEIATPNWWLRSVRPLTARGVPLVLGIPLLINRGETFAQGASGAYDRDFRSLAKHLVQAGDSDAILRLGWEFNGNWFPWSLSARGDDSPGEFVAYWRRVVTVMRSVRGAAFRFVWNVNNGPEPVDATRAYPGSAYVDYVGVDAYDNGYGVAGAAARWNQIVNQRRGLNYWLRFARRRDKPLAIPEWGIGNAGDDPYYIQKMYGWMKSNRIGFESFFDYSDPLTSGAYPRAAAQYRELW
jgi:Glycosyl hydrolase family 26